MAHPPIPVFLPGERFVTLPFSASGAPARVWKVNEQGVPEAEESTVSSLPLVPKTAWPGTWSVDDDK